MNCSSLTENEGQYQHKGGCKYELCRWCNFEYTQWTRAPWKDAWMCCEDAMGNLPKQLLRLGLWLLDKAMDWHQCCIVQARGQVLTIGCQNLDWWHNSAECIHNGTINTYRVLSVLGLRLLPTSLCSGMSGISHLSFCWSAKHAQDFMCPIRDWLLPWPNCIGFPQNGQSCPRHSWSTLTWHTRRHMRLGCTRDRGCAALRMYVLVGNRCS
jgi:hypothetical protein